MTIWFLAVFAPLLITFSAYVYSQVSRDLQRQFDKALQRNAQATSSYFQFSTDNNISRRAQETVHEVRMDHDVSTAIFKEGKLLAISDPDTSKEMTATGILSDLRFQGLGYSPTKAVRALDSEGRKTVRSLSVVEGSDRFLFVTELTNSVRLVGISFEADNETYEVVVAEPLEELFVQLRRIRQILFVGLGTALALSAVGAFLLAKKSLSPIVTISEQAAHISATNLSERLAVAHPKDELGQLVTVINSLLSRLDTSFQLMVKFIADASHEFRTPLAIIQGESEVSLARERGSEEYKESLRITLEQSKRMSHLVANMLALARLDTGSQPLQHKELFFDNVVAECYKNVRLLAGLKGVHVSFEGSQHISFRGDEELLKRMTTNLLDNAVRYTPSGGCVDVKLVRDYASVRLVVSDTGIGMAPHHAARVFDRFYRIAQSLNSSDSGSGLGLSIVKMAAEAHRGSVELLSYPGQGSTFTVFLPLSQHSDILNT